jgi:hypothetical protein
VDNAADDTAIVRPLDTRTSVGSCGSIRFHCSSLSQNSFLRMTLIPFQIRIRIVLSAHKN